MSALPVRPLGKLLLGIVTFCLLLFPVRSIYAHDQAHHNSDLPADLWLEVDPALLLHSAAAPDGPQPTHQRFLALNIAALDTLLAQAPQEGAVTAALAPVLLTVPLPDGTYQRFQIEEYALMTAETATRYPDMKAYQGRSVDDPTSTIALTRVPSGFYAMIRADAGLFFIHPQDTLYVSYAQTDLPNTPWHDNHKHLDATVNAAQRLAPLVSGDKLHTYRLALATTGEFTAQAGGQAKAREFLFNTVSELNKIFTPDLAIRFQLVLNDNMLFPNPASDPYTNGNAGTMLQQNSGVLNNPAILGSTQYDIGHVLGFTANSGGGVGGMGAQLCDVNQKASGASNAWSLTNTAEFVTELLAHEIGHQLGAGHTFNALGAGSCDNNNIQLSSAYEPGGGTTIMSYSGSCGAQNVVQNSDSYFHAINLQEITTRINQAINTCGIHTDTGNAIPTVNAGVAQTIPVRTAFALAGQAADANNDPLTYVWEQFDRGNGFTDNVLPNPDTGSNPIFRSYPPTGNNVRYFPTLSAGANNNGETLPTTNRLLNFRLTVRDGKGGVNAGDVAVQVVNSAGPFVLTAPTLGAIWPPNSLQTVSWQVANTDQPPLNCTSVDILLSTDQGKTFTALRTGTPNDGAESVTTPSVVGAALLKVQCSNQIFFAISPPPGIQLCQPVLQEDHETTPTRWTVPPTEPNDANGWRLRTNGGFSGNNYWYVPNFESQGVRYLESPELTAVGTETTLSFVHKQRFANFTFTFNGQPVTINQRGRVQIKINGGDWQELQSFATNTEQYNQVQIPLTTINNNDKFQLRFVRDHSSQPNGFYAGGGEADAWFVDDVLVCGNGATPPPAANAQATWTGAGADDHWQTAANWNGGLVPQANVDVRIPAGLNKYPTIQADAQVHHLLIESGATVKMTDGILDVYGDWAEQDAPGGGQPGGTATYCRGVSAGDNGNTGGIALGAATVSDQITVPSGGALTDLDVQLDGTHTWVGDLVASLKHESDGTQITLLDPDDNCSGDNFAITLDDSADAEAATSCTNNTPAYPGTRYRPQQALSAFTGKLAAGVWTLTFSDIYAEGDTGFLNRWCLNVTTQGAGGPFTATGGTVRFRGATQNFRPAPGSVFNHIQIGNGDEVVQVQLAADLDVNGNLVIAAGGQLLSGVAAIHVAGNWTQSTANGFNGENGALFFDGANQTVSGTLIANNLTIAATSSVNFGANTLTANRLVNNGAIQQRRTVPANQVVWFFNTGGYGGVGLFASNAALNDTTVTIRKQLTGCAATPGHTIQRCFRVEPTVTSGVTVQMTFFYEQSEQLSHSCPTLNGYQDNGSGGVLTALPRRSSDCVDNLRNLVIQDVNNFAVTDFVLGVDVGAGGARDNEAPVAGSDALTTTVDTAITIDALQNDFDPEGGALLMEAANLGQPQHGTATVNSKQRIVYTPAAGFVGTDSFTYEVADENDKRTTGTIHVTITGPVSAPQQQLFLPLVNR